MDWACHEDVAGDTAFRYGIGVPVGVAAKGSEFWDPV